MSKKYNSFEQKNGFIQYLATGQVMLPPHILESEIQGKLSDAYSALKDVHLELKREFFAKGRSRIEIKNKYSTYFSNEDIRLSTHIYNLFDNGQVEEAYFNLKDMFLRQKKIFYNYLRDNDKLKEVNKKLKEELADYKLRYDHLIKYLNANDYI